MDSRRESARKAARGGSKGALVRGEAVVRGVLDAALEELARTGYGALRIEDVAARAGVNKTTVYRRWPTKEDLVRAALLSITSHSMALPSTGSLRGDLLEVARAFVSLGRSCQGQTLGRLIFAEEPDSELLSIARSLRNAREAVPRAVLSAAQARGELAPGVDAMLLFTVLTGAVQKKLLLDRDAVDDAFLTRLVDLILHGALAPAATRSPAGPPQAPATPVNAGGAAPVPSGRRRRANPAPKG